MTESGIPSASCTTASALPCSRLAVNTSTTVYRHGVKDTSALLVEVEVARGALLEPQAVVLRRLLEEVGGLLQHVFAAFPVRILVGLARSRQGELRRRLVRRRLRSVAAVVEHGLAPIVQDRLVALVRPGVLVRLVGEAGGDRAGPLRGVLVRGQGVVRPRVVREPGLLRLAGEAPCPRWAERFVLLASDLDRVGTPAALEVEMLADGVVEQSHRPSTAYSALTVRFFPARFALYRAASAAATSASLSVSAERGRAAAPNEAVTRTVPELSSSGSSRSSI